MSAANPLRNIAALASDAVAQAAQRVQLELQSARVEIKETAMAWRTGLALMLTGAVFGTAALFLVVEAHVAALIEAGLSPPLATFLVAAICAAIGLAFILIGRKRLDFDERSRDRTTGQPPGEQGHRKAEAE